MSTGIKCKLKAFTSYKGDIWVPYYLSYFSVVSESRHKRMMLSTEPLKDPINGERGILSADIIKLVG